MSKVKSKPVLEILQQVKYPGYSRDIVSFGMVKGIRVDEGLLVVQLSLNRVEPALAAQLQDEVIAALKAESGFDRIDVQIENPQDKPAPAEQPVKTPQRIPGIKRIIAVSSGKGGVGKSTVAVNLACVAAQSGLIVGILDADIYGPSLPTLMGITERPLAQENGLEPIEKFGVKTMSIGYLVETGQPLIWRGPMLHKALEQLLGDTHWGPLEILFLDLPPGTGDVQLTLAQKFALNGALVVTTPQDIALADVRRGAIMFQHVNVPVLGIIENMSFHHCLNCGHLSYPFGKGGGSREAANLGLPLLGSLPLDPLVREQSDLGTPVVVAAPGSEAARSYLNLWENLQKYLLEEMT